MTPPLWGATGVLHNYHPKNKLTPLMNFVRNLPQTLNGFVLVVLKGTIPRTPISYKNKSSILKMKRLMRNSLLEGGYGGVNPISH